MRVMKYQPLYIKAIIKSSFSVKCRPRAQPRVRVWAESARTCKIITGQLTAKVMYWNGVLDDHHGPFIPYQAISTGKNYYPNMK